MQTLSYKQLSKEEQNIIDIAKSSIHNAYSPINKISIGSSLLTDSGDIVGGANYGISSGLNICAERSVIITANSLGHKAVKVLGLCTLSEEPIIPCGPCRQFLYETGKRSSSDILILSSNADQSKIIKITTSELYPNPYTRV